MVFLAVLGFFIALFLCVVVLFKPIIAPKKSKLLGFLCYLGLAFVMFVLIGVSATHIVPIDTDTSPAKTPATAKATLNQNKTINATVAQPQKKPAKVISKAEEKETISDDSTLKRQGFCYQVESYVNALVDFTTTTCMPKQGKPTDSISLFLLSSAPVFSHDAAKKIWLIASISAIGKVANDYKINVDEVWFTDIRNAKKGKAFILPGKKVVMWQQQISRGQSSLDYIYQQINKNMVKKIVKAKS